jgi:hypothetical protein
MATHTMFQLRYIGVIPQTEYVEYGFRIEDKDKDPRLIVLMIESGFFKKYDLMFQEAPDLCYQKLLAEIQNETAESPVSPRFSVTVSDIAHYRELHPTVKTRKPGSGRRLPTTRPNGSEALAPAGPAWDAPRIEHDTAEQ